MNIENVDISLLKPYAQNAKKHNENQIDRLSKSIKEFGFNQPIVVDKDYNIIVGHARFEASKKIKLKTVPILIVDLPDEKVKAYRIADNKLNESDWDLDILTSELNNLPKLDLEIIGLDIYMPNIKVNDVTDEDIEKNKGILDNKYSDTSQVFTDTICPECGHQFQIRK